MVNRHADFFNMISFTTKQEMLSFTLEVYNHDSNPRPLLKPLIGGLIQMDYH